MNNNYQKIIYNNDDHFTIRPYINEKNLEIILGKNNLDMEYYFWSVDHINSTIIVNKNNEIVYDNIINQFISLANIFIKNNYSIRGKFYFRIQNLICYISIKPNISVNHITIFDTVNIEDNLSNSINFQNQLDLEKFSEKLLQDGKKQIDLLLRKKRRKKNLDRESIKTLNLKPSSYLYLEENNIAIKNTQIRLAHLENKLLEINNFSEYIWKFCILLGSFTGGSIIILYSLFR